MTFPARRRLLWITTALELAALAWLFLVMACPTRISLEQAGLISRDDVFSSFRGEPRCWLFFGLSSAIAVACSLLVDRSLAKRARLESAKGEGARA
jgi:hypothetical protein